jgi:signal transduction histidine kinase
MVALQRPEVGTMGGKNAERAETWWVRVLSALLPEGWRYKPADAPARDEGRSELGDAERVLAITAHEMRGPLTAIIGASTTLRAQHDRLTEAQRETLMNMTLRQSRHLAQLVDDLLVTADVGSSGVILRPELTDLESVVERALETADSKRSAHHLDVSVEPIRCNIDPSRTVQIIRNLVENAYKYTPDECTVRVAVTMVDGNVVIEVADDGGGIPDEDRAALFEPYRRGDRAQEGDGGIGIGLHVVRRLVEAMGGRVDLDSSDEGTTFTVVIPTEVTFEKPSIPSVIDNGGAARTGRRGVPSSDSRATTLRW